MASKKKYSIIDLTGASEMLRKAAFNNFTDDAKDNIEDYITTKQVENLVAEYSLGKDDYGNYLINDKVLEILAEKIHSIILGVSLSKLASNGFLEVCFDDQSKEFVFSKVSGVDNVQ